MFPGFLSMIILYYLLGELGLTGGSGGRMGVLFGLVLVYTASSGMGYYISKGFFDTVPKSLDEAARVDGATRLQVLTRVILPLSKPIIIYTVLTAFMGPWGDFMFGKFIVMNGGAMTSMDYTVAVGLQSISASDQYYGAFCAGGVIVAIPVTILFMILQRYYVEGVTGGAVKG
jgi:arabinogalactan oligomer/maltooligosaccharide transport system permease protein